jgi:hypothetical protein
LALTGVPFLHLGAVRSIMVCNGKQLAPSVISPIVRDAAEKFQTVLRDRFLSDVDPATTDPLLATPPKS